MATKPKISRRWLWYWRCTWTNGYGCYNADYDECRTESRKGWPKQEQAEAAAARHVQQHGDDFYADIRVYRQCESQHVRERRAA